VKQRCLSNDFIAINDNPQEVVVCFYVKQKRGERKITTRESERERVQSVGREGDGVSTKIRTFA
jgi:hypothetical protein